MDFLRSVPMFKNFTDLKIDQLAKISKTKSFSSGEKIINQGEISNKFYVIKQGKVDVFVNSSYTRTLNYMDYFGERSMFFSEPRTATVKANGRVELISIDKNDFKLILEDNLKDFLMNRFNLRDNSIQLSDLIYNFSLGVGNYGDVVQVMNKKNNFLYALKIIPRKKIDQDDLHSYLDLEKKILLQIDHPFIVKLVKTMHDDKYIFFLMELIKGKELFDVIRDIGLLNKEQTQFYCGQILLAINYLHQRKFIHRDVKPENIMIDSSVLKI
jgi:CRP-like cAMP-binding protein